MEERPHRMSGLKEKYIRHILDLSPGDLDGRAAMECTCQPQWTFSSEEEDSTTTSNYATPRLREHWRPRPPRRRPSSDALAEEALGMLSPLEKDEIILRMHAKLRHLSGLIEEAGEVSERTVSGLERAHRDALRTRMLSEQRLREELLRWRHHHPEVMELRQENARLRADNDHGRRQYLLVLGKLARKQKLLKPTTR